MQANCAPSRTKVLTMDSLNPHIKTMQYAVRGPIVLRAAEIEKELEKVNIKGLKQSYFYYWKKYR